MRRSDTYDAFLKKYKGTHKPKEIKSIKKDMIFLDNIGYNTQMKTGAQISSFN